LKKLIIGLIVAVAAAAIMVPLAFAGGGNSDTAKACQQGGWQNFTRQDGTAFKNTGECVSYGAQGGVLNTKPAPAPAGPTEVSAPMFGLDVPSCSVTVPYTKGIDTVLYGVNGYSQTPITQNVTVTGGLDGANGTAPQFWIGYTAQPGYVIINPGESPWHFDFYNGDTIRDC
jgi:hypothetical protein